MVVLCRYGTSQSCSLVCIRSGRARNANNYIFMAVLNASMNPRTNVRGLEERRERKDTFWCLLNGLVEDYDMLKLSSFNYNFTEINLKV